MPNFGNFKKQNPLAMNTESFALRHLGIRPDQLPAMLDVIGVDSLDQLIRETLPDDIRLKREMQLDPPMSENEFLQHIHSLARENQVLKNYIGLGYHPAVTPSVIQRMRPRSNCQIGSIALPIAATGAGSESSMVARSIGAKASCRKRWSFMKTGCTGHSGRSMKRGN